MATAKKAVAGSQKKKSTPMAVKKAAKPAKSAKTVAAKPVVRKDKVVKKAVKSVLKVVEAIVPIALEFLGPGGQVVAAALDLVEGLVDGDEAFVLDDLFNPALFGNGELHPIMDAIRSRPGCRFTVSASHDGRLRAYANAFGLPGNLTVTTSKSE